MAYDLFISYARRDNERGRITQLVERIKANLRLPLAELSTPADFEFTCDKKKKTDFQFECTHLELKFLADELDFNESYQPDGRLRSEAESFPVLLTPPLTRCENGTEIVE